MTMAPPPDVARRQPVHVLHVVHSLDYGGLENGLVNLVNGLSRERFRHTIVALTRASDFRRRITRNDVAVEALGKRPGQDPGAYVRLFGLLRRLRPDIVHTRNYGTLDCAAVAAVAGVPVRIHGEHGWDVTDPVGERRRYQIARRMAGPLITRFVALSREIEGWLVQRCGIASRKVVRICNGVDTGRFRPRASAERTVLPPDHFPPEAVVIGSVTRCNAIKDPLNVVRAFCAVRRRAAAGLDVRLALIGDGPLRADALGLLAAEGMERYAWLPGSRDDIPELMADFDLFALGSLREGISNTILEALASGLPVVATATGGNPELVHPGVNGALVPPGDAVALGDALWQLANDVDERRRQGSQARECALNSFSLDRMIGDYGRLYSDLAPTIRGSR